MRAYIVFYCEMKKILEGLGWQAGVFIDLSVHFFVRTFFDVFLLACVEHFFISSDAIKNG